MEKTHHDDRSLNAIIQDAVTKNWNRTALADIGGDSYTYAQMARRIARLHILFKAAGLKSGDKVALCGKNSSSWAISFIACLTSGVVAVPILHEFTLDNIHTLVNHSDSKLFFVDESIWKSLDGNRLLNIEGVFVFGDHSLAMSRSKSLTDTFYNLTDRFNDSYPDGFLPTDVKYYHDSPSEICIINYTSGSTGSPKGVMLPYLSIWSNIRYSIDRLTFLLPGDGVVNMLPLAHLYGMVFEMLHPIVKGCNCNFIMKAPSPSVILKAFAQIHPKLVITVPLVVEKIIKGKVFPKLRTPRMKLLLKIPGVRTIILKKVGETLKDVFGGKVQEIIIGGAPLNDEVEKFLHKVKFPVTVGYGMTECGPLITYVPSSMARMHTVGKIVDRMELKIDSPDPLHIPGNILVRGDNLMQGYYKNPEATREAFPSGDGWMNTGDMGLIDKDGFISIAGRSKTMILGSSGQNIYPEELEQQINNMPFVNESLVISDNGKLVALIHPDSDALVKAGILSSPEEIKDPKAVSEKVEPLMLKNLKTLNARLESYNRLSKLRIQTEEFEKTPKRSIKRFLYQ